MLGVSPFKNVSHAKCLLTGSKVASVALVAVVVVFLVFMFLSPLLVSVSGCDYCHP